jgi:hypothetical protein
MMALDKTQPRVDAMSLSSEGRLFVAEESSDFFVKSELSDDVREAHAQINNAATDLVDDGDLTEGEAGTGPEGLNPVVFTPQGESLFAEWTQ